MSGEDAAQPVTGNRSRRPRTTDGIMPGFTNLESTAVHGTARRTLRSVKTAESLTTPHKIVEFDDFPGFEGSSSGAETANLPGVSQRATSRPLLPQSWRSRRVNESPPVTAASLSKHEWENEIARHILSLYATSKATEVSDQSTSIVSFVDSKRPDSAALLTMKTDMYLHSPLKAEQSDQEILRAISSRESGRASTAAGGSRARTAAETRPGSKYLDFVAEESFGFVFTPSRRSRPRETPELSTGVQRASPLPSIPPLSKKSLEKKVPRSNHTKVYPIWYVSSGDVVADWRRLPNGAKLQIRLDFLKDQGKFKDYARLLDRIISDLWSSHSRQAKVLDDIIASRSLKFSTNSASEMEPALAVSIYSETSQAQRQTNSLQSELPLADLQRLWRQMIIVTNAMAILSIERKKYTEAYELLMMGETWCKRKDTLDSKTRKELRAYVNTAMAYYYYRRNKVTTALSYTEKALEVYELMEMNDLIGSSLLHVAAVHSIQGNFKESHRVRFTPYSDLIQRCGI